MRENHEDQGDLELDQVLLDFLKRHDRGEIVDRAAFLCEHPEYADRLQELLAAADWIETMAGPTIEVGGLEGVTKSDTSATPELPSEGEESRASYDPNAITLDLKIQFEDLEKKREIFSFVDAPLSSDTDFSLSDVPSLDNTQASLPCRFGEYLLERVLGRGGMGVVYLANQVQLNRRVAIKMIRSGALASDEEVARFYSEARSVAKLDHPNIVTVYHCGESDGHHFFSMDYIPGTDLAKIVSNGPIDPKRAVRYVRDVARAIDYAHEHEVVHRDLKPANVLLDEEDEVYLTDFGLAKQMGGDEGLTATGAALGTPSYMSPEQAAGKSEDQGVATDVYAMGAILFALLTGKPPFQAASVLQTMMQVMHKPAPSVLQLQPNTHVDLETIVSKCLEKSPSLRYATAADLAQDLDRFYNGHPIQARPPSWPRRFRFWFSNIPIVAALTGGRQVDPSTSQRWAQRAFIAIAALMLGSVLFGNTIIRWIDDKRLPGRITIASGAPGGMYYDIAGKLSDRMKTGSGRPPSVISTGGSIENLRQLLESHADVALMQESTIRSDQVAVVAPLFFEAIHILVPVEMEAERIEDLAGKRIVLGNKESGTRQTALRLLKHFGLSEGDYEIVDGDWTQSSMRQPQNVLVAMVKPEQLGMVELLSEGKYRLLSIRDVASLTSTEPMFRFLELKAGAYRGIIQEPTMMIATAALLVVRKDSSARLVEECLSAVYERKPLVDGLIARELAASWQGLPYHEVARQYFSRPMGQ